ncbi:30S ribosomal protein S17 [Candidatus Gottesmanbacteria bacterium RIFCSPLOWO2_01_FULL_39_12b]|uniref:Small ribosomal subunit protein uS17 n=1 Tax=Candidatus Gottesmanbacteria bacterium RIFCSPLOWO2_01_FULL_39_12b TaxID=1798388 RepID=A0A1F6ARZ2_9BACT|nr:MAG: 30S ribosomal protein S17 [Candidatus Gottesmanbacteria bacterium RIFCSPLOWO2_01_FULL_39_12b]
MKELTGKIVSTKMAKTVVVEIVKSRLHPLYKKNMRKTKRYKAHNENLDLQVGDLVKITSHRPISKDKHYKVISKA